MANPMTKTPTIQRTYLRKSASSYIRERQLDERLPIVLILFERKGDVERRLVGLEVVVALGRAPGDGAEDPPFLLEGHLEVPFLELARTVDDFHRPRREDRPRIAGAERRERYNPLRDRTGDGAKREVAIDAQAGHQILGTERLVGDVVDRPPELGHPRRIHRQPGGLGVAAETDEQVRTSLEGTEHVEARDAA